MNIDAWSKFADEHVLITSAEHGVTVGQMREYIATVQRQLQQADVQSCALFSKDVLLFVVVFLACVDAGIDVVLPANNLPEFAGQLKVDCLIGDWTVNALPISLSTGIKNNKPFTAPVKTSAVTLFTSGSTGDPKSIKRNINQLLAEIEVLNKTFANDLNELLFVSTVSHQHIYGLLFTVLWPLLKGHAVWHKLLPFEEMIEDINQINRAWVLVSSPAFLKRIQEDHRSKQSLVKVFSSGGVLTDEQHQYAESQLATTIIQVYGSSETGGIAYRNLGQNWQYFEAVDAEVREGQLWVKSPFCHCKDWLCTQDMIETTKGGFKLLGRSDRIVKIEEKRISLNMIEQQALQLKWIVDAAALIMEENRQFIAAVFEINQLGVDFIEQYGAAELKKNIKGSLSLSIDKIALPRKIRFTTKPLVNAQGKKVNAELLKLFA